MDAIAVARAGISNVVASCGTSLAEATDQVAGPIHAARRRELRPGRGGTDGNGEIARVAARARF